MKRVCFLVLTFGAASPLAAQSDLSQRPGHWVSGSGAGAGAADTDARTGDTSLTWVPMSPSSASEPADVALNVLSPNFLPPPGPSAANRPEQRPASIVPAIEEPTVELATKLGERRPVLPPTAPTPPTPEVTVVAVAPVEPAPLVNQGPVLPPEQVVRRLPDKSGNALVTDGAPEFASAPEAWSQGVQALGSLDQHPSALPVLQHLSPARPVLPPSGNRVFASAINVPTLPPVDRDVAPALGSARGIGCVFNRDHASCTRGGRGL